MHRTTTTATLLVTVAVSALAGCVTVQRPPVSGSPAAPSQPSAPRSDDRDEPPIVLAPGREALEMIGPPRRPKPAAPPSAPAQTRQQLPPPRTQPARPARPEPRRPEPRHPGAGHPKQPGIEIPGVPTPVPQYQQDVCALGRKYGGWQAGSPESTICRQTYGR
ncbi:Lipoprotein OS=Streptomyces alboniger OX=132473 GN=CP975_04775 PE=4 SV=1 [Streptomyces alboniger]